MLQVIIRELAVVLLMGDLRDVKYTKVIDSNGRIFVHLRRELGNGPDPEALLERS
jgi:hypothetical protein